MNAITMTSKSANWRIRERVPSYHPVVPELDWKAAGTLEEANTAKASHERKLQQETLWECIDQIATGRGCGSLNRVADTVYVQTHWYVEPFSCTGGDYWKQGEGVLLCPECGKRNRLHATPELMDMKRGFLRVEDEHDK